MLWKTILQRFSILYWVSFAIGLSNAALGPALPAFAIQTNSGMKQIGLLFTARAFGFLLGSLVIGRAFDKLPGNRLLAGVLVFLSLLLVVMPFPGLLWLLIIILLGVGIAEGSLDIGANLLIVWQHLHNSNPYLNALNFFFGVGAFIAPILIAQSIVLSGGVSWAFWLIALYSIFLAVCLFRRTSPAIFHDALKDLHKSGRWQIVFLIATVFFLYVGAEVSFGGWIYTYAITLGLAGITSAAYLTSLFWGSLTIGRLAGVLIATRFEPQKILLTDLAGCLVSISIVLFFPGSISLWIGAFGLGFAMASIFPTLLAFAERHLALSGVLTRWFFVATGLGGMLLPWVIGWIFEQLGPQWVMLAIALDLFLALVIFVAILAYIKSTTKSGILTL